MNCDASCSVWLLWFLSQIPLLSDCVWYIVVIYVTNNILCWLICFVIAALKERGVEIALSVSTFYLPSFRSSWNDFFDLCATSETSFSTLRLLLCNLVILLLILRIALSFRWTPKDQAILGCLSMFAVFLDNQPRHFSKNRHEVFT